MATLKKYSNDSIEIYSNSATLISQDIKDYGKATLYKDDKGIYVNYKANDQDKYLAIYFENEEITSYRNGMKLNNKKLMEIFDCPEVSPRKIFLTDNQIIFKNRKYSNDIIYSLDY